MISLARAQDAPQEAAPLVGLGRLGDRALEGVPEPDAAGEGPVLLLHQTLAEPALLGVLAGVAPAVLLFKLKPLPAKEDKKNTRFCFVPERSSVSVDPFFTTTTTAEHSNK